MPIGSIRGCKRGWPPLDNVTHTLIGALVGEALARRVRPPRHPAPLRPLPDVTFRRLVVVGLIVGSNLPDADLLYSSFAGGPLGYVLQHRGYTHTLVGALAGAALLWLAVLLWLRYRQLRADAAERGWIAAACVIGVLLHLAMDYTNNYGVHPFWPFYNGWLYGDSVFILEPLLWLAAAPLIFVAESAWARMLVAVAVAVITLAVSASGLVAKPAVIAFLLLGVAMLAAGRWLQPGMALACGIALWLGVTGIFGVAGRVAARRLDAAAAVAFPGSHSLDRVLTPTPADPLCWDAWLVQAHSAGETMRQARISLLPGLIDVHNCRGMNLGASRDGEPVAAADDAGLQWLQQFSLPGDRIARLAATQCRARAFMQFARVPMAESAGSGWSLGDLRFGGGRGFSWLQLTQPAQRCDFPAVPWLPPRPELLVPPG
jgi:inner membrane protein